MDSQGGHQCSALRVAAEIVYFLGHGGSFDGALQAGMTRLSWGHKAIIRLLLLEETNVKAVGGKCGIALQAARLQGQDSIVRLLLERGAGVS